MGGGGQIIFRGHFWKMPVKLFFPANSFLGSLLCVLRWLGQGLGRYESIRNVSFTS